MRGVPPSQSVRTVQSRIDQPALVFLFLDEMAGFNDSDRCTSHAVYQVMHKGLLATALPGRPMHLVIDNTKLPFF